MTNYPILKNINNCITIEDKINKYNQCKLSNLKSKLRYYLNKQPYLIWKNSILY